MNGEQLNGTPIETEPKPIFLTVRVDVERAREIPITPSALLRLPEQLSFAEGITLIVGPNGVGKTTLLKGLHLCLVGMKKASDRSVISGLPAFHFSSYLKPVSTNIDYILQYDGTVNPKDGPMLPWGALPGENLSQRQARDKAVSRIQSLFDGTTAPLIVVDEYEMGIDPWRHQEIEAEMKALAPERSMVIAATNSPILVLSTDLPRIDLRYPERGVHRVSNYL